MATIYVDETVGTDDAQGTKEQPFKTLGQAYLQHADKVSYMVKKQESPDEPADWKPAAKAALKKAVNFAETARKKAAKEQELALRQKKEDDDRQRVLDEAKKIVLTEDASLPKPLRIKLDQPAKLDSGDRPTEVDYSSDKSGARVRVIGRVSQVRKQKDIIFVVLRDGYGSMQCVLTGQLSKTYDALTLTRETTLEITGEMWQVPAGLHAPLDRELHADFFRIPPGGKAVGGDDAITNKVQAGGDPQTLLDMRHLVLRGDTMSKVMRVRHAVEAAFHKTYDELRCRKVSPPALVQTQCEGGATLFKFDYYGQEAYLTQSSQLYLETCLPLLGDVYCIEKSFRAEKSLTRRHLSEYTHIEAELDFITFDDLLSHLEHVMCRVLELIMADPLIASFVKDLHPEFEIPQRPFMRMKYADAIEWLKEHDIPNEEGQPHAFGDDIAEAAERRMTDIINRPIFLTGFPADLKAFYMQKDAQDPRVTESVDCLMPGVGEIVGGSMRMYDYEELMAAYAREGLDPKPYYWYTDQRRCVSSEDDMSKNDADRLADTDRRHTAATDSGLKGF